MKTSSDNEIINLSFGNQENRLTQNFAIADTPEFFQLLSDSLYSDPLIAVFRETITNAYDANIENNLKDTPVIVNFDNYTLTIKDNGKGINPDKIQQIYCTYGLSTKTQTDLTGGFGLGCKTPFAVGDSFMVQNNYKGKCYTYLMQKTEQKPTVTTLSVTDSIENGVKVTVNFKKDILCKYVHGYDYNHYFQNIMDSIAHLCAIPLIYNNKEYIFKHPDSTLMFLNTDPYIGYVTITRFARRITLKYGNNVFIAELDKIEKVLNSHDLSIYNKFIEMCELIGKIYNKDYLSYVMLKMPSNSLDILPSREGLRYSSHTINSIIQVMENVVNEAKKLSSKVKFSTIFKKFTSISDFYNYCLYPYTKKYLLDDKSIYALKDLETFLACYNQDFAKNFIKYCHSKAVALDKNFNDDFYANLEQSDEEFLTKIINNYILGYMPDKTAYDMYIKDGTFYTWINNPLKIERQMKGNETLYLRLNIPIKTFIPHLSIFITPYLKQDIIDQYYNSDELDSFCITVQIKSRRKANVYAEALKKAGKNVVNLFDYIDETKKVKNKRNYENYSENDIYYDSNYESVVNKTEDCKKSLIKGMYLPSVYSDYSYVNKDFFEKEICRNRTLKMVNNKIELKRAMKSGAPYIEDMIIHYFNEMCKDNNFKNIVAFLLDDSLTKYNKYSASNWLSCVCLYRKIIFYIINNKELAERYNFNFVLTDNQIEFITLLINIKFIRPHRLSKILNDFDNKNCLLAKNLYNKILFYKDKTTFFNYLETIAYYLNNLKEKGSLQKFDEKDILLHLLDFILS